MDGRLGCLSEKQQQQNLKSPAPNPGSPVPGSCTHPARKAASPGTSLASIPAPLLPPTPRLSPGVTPSHAGPLVPSAPGVWSIKPNFCGVLSLRGVQDHAEGVDPNGKTSSLFPKPPRRRIPGSAPPSVRAPEGTEHRGHREPPSPSCPFLRPGSGAGTSRDCSCPTPWNPCPSRALPWNYGPFSAGSTGRAAISGAGAGKNNETPQDLWGLRSDSCRAKSPSPARAGAGGNQGWDPVGIRSWSQWESGVGSSGNQELEPVGIRGWSRWESGVGSSGNQGLDPVGISSWSRWESGVGSSGNQGLDPLGIRDWIQWESAAGAGGNQGLDPVGIRPGLRSTNLAAVN
ncbi:uncharacterized protein LOC116455827 [Corvus moneduloides]|uniref:uncharacterized protein LOC116455827 n=1 Tax=Corvus moneduloides TaxID=1196302 RepID=UPI001362A14F|nr:uncharacterized protein LOC116455827 [Corvus moneduloides]